MDSLWVTGSTGFLGPHVLKRLGLPKQHRVDLRSSVSLRAYLMAARPETVVHLAYPGSRGIATSVEEPLSLAADLLRMDANLIEAAAKSGVKTLLALGSVCSYPEFTTLPTDESQLWAGYPEPVNAAYGCAKRMQGVLLQAARQQYGLRGVQLILANLYGPGDRSGHVIPSLIRKIRAAKASGGEVVVWGEPEVTRSFLYVEDAAEGLARALDGYDSPEPLNLCADEEVSMADLVESLLGLLDYTGPVRFDSSQPTGHRRRRFDTTRLRQALGWVPSTRLTEGLSRTVDWMLVHDH